MVRGTKRALAKEPEVKAEIPKWKSAATAALSAHERNRQMLPMSAQPFILTIDSIYLFCYPHHI